MCYKNYVPQIEVVNYIPRIFCNQVLCNVQYDAVTQGVCPYSPDPFPRLKGVGSGDEIKTSSVARRVLLMLACLIGHAQNCHKIRSQLREEVYTCNMLYLPPTYGTVST